jgi:hypothetical protein
MLFGRLLRHIVIVTANGTARGRATLAPRFCSDQARGAKMTWDDLSKRRAAIILTIGIVLCLALSIEP